MNKTNVYASRAFDFIQKIQELDDFEQITEAVIEELEWFGLTYVTILNMPPPGKDILNASIINTRPQEFTDRYLEKNLVFKDPVVTELRHTFNTYSWQDVIQRRDLSKAELDIVYHAKNFNATDGLMIPIVSRCGKISLFCPCGEDPNLSPEARSALEIIAMFSHQAFERTMINLKRTQHEVEPLTPREREIMHWVAAGKTDDEIGRILTIAASTVTFHIENAKKKLNTFKRTFAVVQAIRAGEIHL